MGTRSQPGIDDDTAVLNSAGLGVRARGRRAGGGKGPGRVSETRFLLQFQATTTFLNSFCTPFSSQRQQCPWRVFSRLIPRTEEPARMFFAMPAPNKCTHRHGPNSPPLSSASSKEPLPMRGRGLDTPGSRSLLLPLSVQCQLRARPCGHGETLAFRGEERQVETMVGDRMCSLSREE